MEDKIPFNLPVTTGSNQEKNSTVLAQIAGSREVTEAQAAIMVAKRFPRNEMEVLDKILLACQRPALAESALYSYSKGGTAITGASIRLAETIFRLWGNGSCGLRELESRYDESVLEAFAVDYETNVRQSKIFTVKHERSTKKGNYAINDPRERYENLANFGARRLRACILSLVPADILESALEQCEETLKAKADTSPPALQKVIEAFGKFSVTKEQIEARIQRRFETITPAQLVQLRKVYNSLKDGMSSPADWFQPATDAPQETLKDKIKAKLETPPVDPPTIQPPPITEQDQKPEPDPAPEKTEAPAPPEAQKLNVDSPVHYPATVTVTPPTTPVESPPEQVGVNAAWTDFRAKFINLKGPGYSTFVFKNLEHFRACPKEISMEAIEKWVKLYPGQAWPGSPLPDIKPPVTTQPVSPASQPPSVTYTAEYKALSDLKNEFPDIYRHARAALNAGPDTVENCIKLTAWINRKIDEQIAAESVQEEPPLENEVPYSEPEVTDTSGF